MTRSLSIVLLLGCALLSGAGAQAAPVLRSSVTVDDDLIRLGDIFDDAGNKADTVVATAPPFGHQAVYDAAWLFNVARANGLEWQPASRTDHVTVERAAHAIPAARIEDALKAAVAKEVAARGGSNKVLVNVDNRSITLYADPDAGGAIQIRDLWLDRDASRFTATIAASDQPDAQTTKVSGRVYQVTSVPVLTRRVAASDVVGAKDIRFVDVRNDALTSDAITDPDALIGMSPRRQAVDGVPLRAGDFRAPVVVSKGTLVTMIVQTPYMLLTAQGRAVEDGAKGDVIKVMNTQSKTTVDAVVDSATRVFVQTPAALQAVASPGGRTFAR